jgi:lipoprotein NlpI
MLATKIERDDGKWKMANGIFRRRGRNHSPFSILPFRCLFFLVFAVFLAGCAPPGPRALLAGKKLLDRGDYAGAVAELKTATALLATNAVAWNDYGVALQHAGQAADAAQAYQSALKFDRDLVEARFNLGCLWLEQSKFADAKTEFTAFTLRRSNSPEGWLMLGTAQLKLHELPLAEKSFSTAYYLNTNNAEALNGLGLARVTEGRPQDAAKFFAAAIAAHPDYAPARLNLAIVEQQYLRDDSEALRNYRAYLALAPRPADWQAVNDLVTSRGQPAPAAETSAPAARENETAAPARPVAVETKPPPPPHVRPLLPPREERNAPVTPRPRTEEVATVRPQPAKESVPRSSVAENRVPRETPVEPATTENPGGLRRFNPIRESNSSTPRGNYTQNGVTPLTPNKPSLTVVKPPAPAKPVRLPPPAPPVFPRYLYLSPPKPRVGDRKAATVAFAAGQQAEKERDLAAAVDAYRRAAELDPSWFDAQYDYAVLAYKQNDYRRALTAGEMALALRPDSVDARYGFALALKAAGYATDALNELNKIVAAHPDESRAQLALGNLYAQEMRDPAKARPHYLKWLELDPQNPQAINIRVWLSQNPP